MDDLYTILILFLFMVIFVLGLLLYRVHLGNMVKCDYAGEKYTNNISQDNQTKGQDSGDIKEACRKELYKDNPDGREKGIIFVYTEVRNECNGCLGHYRHEGESRDKHELREQVKRNYIRIEIKTDGINQGEVN